MHSEPNFYAWFLPQFVFLLNIQHIIQHSLICVWLISISKTERKSIGTSNISFVIGSFWMNKLFPKYGVCLSVCVCVCSCSIRRPQKEMCMVVSFVLCIRAKSHFCIDIVFIVACIEEREIDYVLLTIEYKYMWNDYSSSVSAKTNTIECLYLWMSSIVAAYEIQLLLQQ